MLEDLKARYEFVGDVRYKGLVAAIELVSDRATKKAAAKAVMKAVADAAYEASIMLRVSGSNIILSPPLILTTAQVQEIGAGLDAGLAAV